jgi:peptidylprolyl isomerase/peptidyl-prolyl cis-trans isomerase B (cyclophilin B)
MYTTTPAMEIDPAKYYYATIMTEKGDIEVQLFADRAPKTVNNFVYLARQGFYDDTSFHRVLDGFMAQGGDPTGSGSGGPGYEFEDEIVQGLVFDQSGLLAMANRGPGTNGSQFFITFGPTEWLNGNHTIFGKVIAGEEVLSALTRRDPEANAGLEGDLIYTILIEESESSILPTPTPSPPTPTPTLTPTPFAPTGVEGETQRPLAEVPAAERANYFNTAPEMVIDTARTYTATITTSKGMLVARLYDDEAPVAVNNFVVLSNLGFYDQMPISQVQPGDSIIFGAPANNPLADVGYRVAAELGAITTPYTGTMTYIPMEQQPDGTILSSGSLMLIALLQPPPQANAQFPFFAQVVEGVDLLNQLTTADTIDSITITSNGE